MEAGVACVDPKDLPGASGSDDDGADGLDYDAIAEAAVRTALKLNSKERECGLDIGLSNRQLYITDHNSSRKAFDTSAVPGQFTFDADVFNDGLVPDVPKPSVWEREQRGACIRPLDDSKLKKKESKKLRDAKLKGWYGLPRQQLTPQLRRELMAIKLRGSIDPKRFYKANDTNNLPTHFVVATEVGGGMAPAGLRPRPEPRPGSGASFLDSLVQDESVQDWTWKKANEVLERGTASLRSGHGFKKGNRRKASTAKKKTGKR